MDNKNQQKAVDITNAIFVNNLDDTVGYDAEKGLLTIKHFNPGKAGIIARLCLRLLKYNIPYDTQVAVNVALPGERDQCVLFGTLREVIISYYDNEG